MVHNYANAFSGGAARRSQRKKRGTRSARKSTRADDLSSDMSSFSSSSSDRMRGSEPKSLFDLISQKSGSSYPIKRSASKPIAGDRMSSKDLPALLSNMMAMHDTTGIMQGNPATKGLMGYATGLLNKQIMPAHGTIPLPGNVDDLLYGQLTDMAMRVSADAVEKKSNISEPRNDNKLTEPRNDNSDPTQIFELGQNTVYKHYNDITNMNKELLDYYRDISSLQNLYKRKVINIAMNSTQYYVLLQNLAVNMRNLKIDTNIKNKKLEELDVIGAEYYNELKKLKNLQNTTPDIQNIIDDVKNNLDKIYTQIIAVKEWASAELENK